MLLLNATGAGTETLKNLILPAVGRFTIADGGVITERDAGNNFFLPKGYLGKPRAEVACELLKELNPDVEGDFLVESAESVANNEEVLKKYSLIIASDVANVREKPTNRVGYGACPEQGM